MPYPDFGDLCVIIPTIERFFPCVSRLVLSIRKIWGPKIAVYVGVQGDQSRDISEFAEIQRVNISFLPYDFGLAATRNYLVRRVKEQYILLVDDDIEITQESDINTAVNLLKTHSDILIVGGAYTTYFSDGMVKFENFASQMFLDDSKKILVSVPIAYLDLQQMDFEGFHFVICDMVNNFAVINKQVFSEYKVFWDERFKIRGEHEDFFLTIKNANLFKVAYCNCLIANHIRESSPSYFQLRKRKNGTFDFLQKWGLNQYLFVGKKNIHAIYNKNEAQKDKWEILDDYR